jgi:hypothetical protein
MSDCTLTESQLKTLRDEFINRLLKYLRDSRKTDSDIIYTPLIESLLNNELYEKTLKPRWVREVGTSGDECAALTKLHDDLSYDLPSFDLSVKRTIDNSILSIDEFIVKNIYLSRTPKVEWFLDEGLAMTIFQDALIPMSALIGLFNLSVDISKKMIDYAISEKLVNQVSTAAEPTGLPEIRAYLQQLVAYPIFRNAEIARIEGLQKYYQKLIYPKRLTPQNISVSSDSQGKNVAIAILGVTALFFGASTYYLLKSRKDNRTTALPRTRQEPAFETFDEYGATVADVPAYYAQTNIPALKR